MLGAKYPTDENRYETENPSIFEVLSEICGKLKHTCLEHYINVKM